MIDVRSTNDHLQSAYQRTFASPEGRQVLADLVAYCHGRKSTFDPNERVHAFKDGQRDVLMRIQEFTCLSIEEIYQLRGVVRAKPDEE